MKGGSLDRLIDHAAALEPYSRTAQLVRSTIGLAVTAPILMVGAGLALWWAATGSRPLLAAGVVLVAGAGIMMWVVGALRLRLRQRLWSQWPVERVRADPQGFRNQAAVVIPHPTWGPWSLVVLGVGVFLAMAGVPRSGLEVSFGVWLALAAGVGLILAATGVFGARALGRRLEIGQRLSAGADWSSQRADPGAGAAGGGAGGAMAGAGAGAGAEGVVAGLDAASAAGLVDPGAPGPRVDPTERVVWHAAGNPAGLKSGSVTGMDGIQREHSPHDGVVCTDRALYLVNVVEPVRSIEVPSMANAAEHSQRLLATALPLRTRELLARTLAEVGLHRLVAADPRNLRFGYHELAQLRVRRRPILYPLVTITTHDGVTEKFVIYDKDIDRIRAALAPTAAPLRT